MLPLKKPSYRPPTLFGTYQEPRRQAPLFCVSSEVGFGGRGRGLLQIVQPSLSLFSSRRGRNLLWSLVKKAADGKKVVRRGEEEVDSCAREFSSLGGPFLPLRLLMEKFRERQLLILKSKRKRRRGRRAGGGQEAKFLSRFGFHRCFKFKWINVLKKLMSTFFKHLFFAPRIFVKTTARPSSTALAMHIYFLQLPPPV